MMIQQREISLSLLTTMEGYVLVAGLTLASIDSGGGGRLYASSIVCALLIKIPFCRLVGPSICSVALIVR